MFFSGLRHIRTRLLSLTGVKYPHYCTCVFSPSKQSKMDSHSACQSSDRHFARRWKCVHRGSFALAPKIVGLFAYNHSNFVLLLSVRSSTLWLLTWLSTARSGISSFTWTQLNICAAAPVRATMSLYFTPSSYIHGLFWPTFFFIFYFFFYFLFVLVLPSKGGSTARLKWSVIRWDKNVPSCYEAGVCWCALSLTIALLKFYCWCVFVFCSRGHVVAEMTV